MEITRGKWKFSESGLSESSSFDRQCNLGWSSILRISLVAEVKTMASIRTRRNLIEAMTAFAGLMVAEGLFTESRMGAAQTPQPMQSPNAPANQNIPGGLDNPKVSDPNRPPTRTMSQEQIAANVQQLYKLALELKTEVEQTNLSMTLPVDFVKKAQQIEKLAKQIRQHA
jgi:hypothetical protein